MTKEKEKSVLVHWCYSVSEWEEFVKRDKKNRDRDILVQSGLIWALGTLIIYFALHLPLMLCLVISGNIAIVYGVLKYYIRTWMIKWKSDQMPEIIVTDGTAIVNGNPILFQGNGKYLRKVDVKQDNNVNIVEITFEKQTRKGISFDAIIIPVPRGKLREAVELQDCLNLRRDILSLFN
jgi:hypothetical protein